MSDEFFPAYIPDKDELKKRLPMEFVCAELGVGLGHDGRALCPWHEADGGTHSPSFYLWDGDDGITRFSCHPCGIQGDIFELLMRYEGLTFGESVRRAAEMFASMPEDYISTTPKVTHERPDFRPTWEQFVNGTRAYAASKPGLLALISGLVDDTTPEAVAHEWDTYLRDTWGWGLDEQFNVYMPHWDAAMTMTGCKVRRGGAKDSLSGSTYSQLYGAWQPLHSSSVLLAEGESDCVYAAFNAMKEGIPLTVRALPSGTAKLDEAWIASLRGATTIYLALDPDTGAGTGAIKGVEATRMWIALLAKSGFRDVRVCSLPLEKDMKAAHASVSYLLSGSMRPVMEPDDISRNPGGYERIRANGNPYAVTDWTAEPIARLIGGDEPGYEILLSHRGINTETVIRLRDLANVAKLKEWAKSNGLLFTGRQDDVEAVARLIFARGSITPEIFQTDQVGIQLPPPAYEFLGPTFVYPNGGYEGQLPWRYVPTVKTADVSDKMRLPARAEQVWKWRWLEEFLALSDTHVMHPILAWLAASARRHEATEFPLLFIGGSSGVGKSTLAELGIQLMGSRIELDLGSVTQLPLVKTFASTTNIPVFIDEWTRLSRDDSRRAFQSYIPAIYSGGLAERGTSDLGAQVYRMTAPVIVAGEDTFMLDREKDRMVPVRPTRAAQNHAALAAIEHAPLYAFAKAYHRWLVSKPAGLPSMAYSAATRPAHNRDILLAGWATLRPFMQGVAANDPTVPDLPEVPDLSCFEVEEEVAEDNAYEQALREGFNMRDRDGARVVWPDPAGNGTWVRAKFLVKLIEERTDIELPGRSRAMLDYFRERYELKQAKVVPPLGTSEAFAALVTGLHLAEAEPEEDASEQTQL